MAHAQYLTFEEYKKYGGALTQPEFIPLEFRARKQIDYLTNSRIQNMECVPEAVRLCILSAITILGAAGAEAQIKNPTVTSYNTDGYSESYGKALGADDADKAVTNIIKTGLYGENDDNGVPLLYRGVDV